MRRASTSAPLTVLFALTMFLSAVLLFAVQPLFTKLILPRFGGTPAVWNTCQVFFQAALLAGYLYAHVVHTRLSVRGQVLLHAAMLLLPCTILPIGVASGWEPPSDANPLSWLLGLLTVSVGLPFLVVATNAPLLQSWYARARQVAAPDPYFLYAASNLGSLGILVAYPLVVEPALSLRTQSIAWSCGYAGLVVFVLCCGVSVWPAGRNAVKLTRDTPATVAAASLTTWTRLRWTSLALVPSSLMLSVTLYLTADIASMPLLWVLPLALYLLSFVVTFARWQVVPLTVVARIMPLFVIGVVLVLVSEATHPAWLLMLVHLAAFFVIALVCHGELAASRPVAERLTEFYLWLSVGGVLGGIFCALVAPLVFRSIAEYPLALVAACLLRPAPRTSTDDSAVHVADHRHPGMSAAQLDFLLPLALAILTWVLVIAGSQSGLAGASAVAVGFGLPILICYLFLFRPVRFALGIAALLLVVQFRMGVHGNVLFSGRSFFGIHRVTIDPTGRFVQLVHGSTVHGMQIRSSPAGNAAQAGAENSLSAIHPDPLTYYHRTGPIAEVFALPQIHDSQSSIAIVGLGAGSLASYAAPAQELDFYEIDPVVVQIAKDARYFTFLSQCPGNWRVILGDARLKLAAAADQRYGLIVIDAFSSDAVPLHLITREAVALYLKKLAPDGVIAFNVSSRYLELRPVLADLARDQSLVCFSRSDLDVTSEEHQQGKSPSIWVVLARQHDAIAELTRERRWQKPFGQLNGAPWTDDYANVLGTFKWE